jgi:hypothetical protein
MPLLVKVAHNWLYQKNKVSQHSLKHIADLNPMRCFGGEFPKKKPQNELLHQPNIS